MSGALALEICEQVAKDFVKDMMEEIAADANDKIGNVDPSEDPTPELVLRESLKVMRRGLVASATWGIPGGGWHGLGTLGYAIVHHEGRSRVGGNPYASSALKENLPEIAPKLAARVAAAL